MGNNKRIIKKKKRLLLNIFIISLFLAPIIFISSFRENIITKLENKFSYNGNEDKEISEENIDSIDISKEEKNNKDIQSMINNMTLEEKIGQLFIVNLEDINNNLDCTSFNENMADNIKKYNVGGVIFFQKNIVNREQVQDLISNIKKNSKINPFVSVDEEGGIVARIGNTPAMNTTTFEDMAIVGESGNFDRAYEIGSTIGKEIYELGFNLDFAPIADVITNPNNTEIGVRSFGSDPILVSEMVDEVVRGLQDNKVSATLKHFPGHGDSEHNSHNEFSYSLRSLDEMRETEFLPFISGIKQGVDFIMISHISAPNVTGSDSPSSLSSVIITDLLRNELNYENVITTDALNMRAISDYYSPEDAAVKAINAGADILLMSPDFELVYNAVINAVKSDLVSEERINESVYRILNVKMKRGILNN